MIRSSVSRRMNKCGLCLDLKNSDAEVIRSLDVTDMSNLRIEKKGPQGYLCARYD